MPHVSVSHQRAYFRASAGSYHTTFAFAILATLDEAKVDP
jgi:hypothetical protein